MFSRDLLAGLFVSIDAPADSGHDTSKRSEREREKVKLAPGLCDKLRPSPTSSEGGNAEAEGTRACNWLLPPASSPLRHLPTMGWDHVNQSVECGYHVRKCETIN
jgi:hypothetical protein